MGVKRRSRRSKEYGDLSGVLWRSEQIRQEITQVYPALDSICRDLASRRTASGQLVNDSPDGSAETLEEEMFRIMQGFLVCAGKLIGLCVLNREEVANILRDDDTRQLSTDYCRVHMADSQGEVIATP